MTQVYKTVITLTVFHDEKDTLDGLSLTDIDYETNDGRMIGFHEITSSQCIRKEDLKQELQAIGNDGTFFDIFGDGDE